MNIKALSPGIQDGTSVNYSLTVIMTTFSLVIPASPMASVVNAAISLAESLFCPVRSAQGSIDEAAGAINQAKDVLYSRSMRQMLNALRPALRLIENYAAQHADFLLLQVLPWLI